MNEKETEELSLQALVRHLASTGIRPYFFEETDSTNADAKSLFESGSETPFVVAALRQRKGRGRLGRSFSSPEGGAYFSLCLSSREIGDPEMLTLSAAAALANELERITGVETAIKWVNDIYIRGKKAAGILTEGILSEDGRLEAAVIGCGIDWETRESDFPPDVRLLATSFYPEGRAEASKAECIAAACSAILSLQNKDFLPYYRSKCFVTGKRVTVVRGEERREAEALSIDGKGHLVVRYDSGEEEGLFSGEVSLRL